MGAGFEQGGNFVEPAGCFETSAPAQAAGRFCEGDLGFVYAFRGVGKTWLALAMARALSEGGSVGPWQAPEATKVLYIDGEMPADLMRARDVGLKQGAGEIEFLNHEILFDRTERVLNITDLELQKAITGHCLESGVKVVIIDNLSTLASGMKENDSFEWEKVNNWLLQFRRHKIAVIVVHHAGRNGEARGTSKREDAAFWVIALDDAKKHATTRREHGSFPGSRSQAATHKRKSRPMNGTSQPRTRPA